MNRLSRTRSQAGFTLVELLVVVGIIVVLMSLLLTAVPAVKDAQRKLDARQTSSQIVAAVNAYYTEYAKFPPVVSAEEAAKSPNNAQKDTVVGDEKMSATAQNAALFNTLRNIPKTPNENYILNPRRVVFYEGKAAIVATGNKPRQGFFDRTNDGAAAPEQLAGGLYDPWGKQFGVVVDTTGDERINLDGYYADFTGDDPTTGKAPRKRVGAFSMGKDETLGKNGDRTYRKGNDVSDDVISWE
jgi:prepilin-type N-terminal cleavage/methylation domain-containing protein